MMTNEEQVAQLESLVQHPGWRLLAKYVEREMGWADMLAKQTLEERQAPKFSDEFLRAYWRGMRFVLAKPALVVSAFQQEAEEQKREQQESEVQGEGSPYGAGS